MPLSVTKTLTNGEASFTVREITPEDLTILADDGSVSADSINFQRRSSVCATYKSETFSRQNDSTTDHPSYTPFNPEDPYLTSFTDAGGYTTVSSAPTNYLPLTDVE